jgi:uncharacterized protein (TIGR03437 family)
MTLLLRSSASAFFLTTVLAAQLVRLTPGQNRRFQMPPQAGPSVLAGFAVTAPGGTSRLTIEAETDNPSLDISLWTRFGQNLEVQGGTVTRADFSSQTLGLEPGRERIVITSASTPPLQTGTYYIAVATTQVNTAITGTLRVSLDGGGTFGTYLISTFDADAEGWGRNFPESPLPGATVGDPGSFVDWSSLGGSPGGYLRMNDANGDVQDAAVAPPKFLGNLAALVNPRIEFDFRHVSGGEAIFVLRVRILANGGTFDWTSSEPPSASWTHYRLPLNSATFRRFAGQEPLEQALTNVQRIEITMDQLIGSEINGIDNFALIGELPPGQPGTVPVPSAPVVSNFDLGADGWGRNYPPSPLPGASIGDSESVLSWQLEGGNPGGWIRYRDAGSGDPDFFVAPPKFLGNLAALQNPRLEFDYRHTADVTGLGPMAVRLVGAGSSFVWIGGSPAPFGAFSRFQVPLGEAFFVRESGAASFGQLLTNVQRIEISAEMAPGPETDGLDNVSLLTSPVPPLRPVLSAGPANLTFSGTAGGANPASQSLRISSGGDTIPWTAAVEPASPWLLLSAASGVTPMTINVAANLAGLNPGTYTATIRVEAPAASNSPQTVAVRLDVAPSPATLPRINAGSIGNAAAFRPPLAAGALSTLFGVNLGPAEGVSAAFLPGTQSLPTSLRGVKILIRDVGGALIAEAPLLYVSATQINFQMPFEAAGRSSVAVVVDNNGLQSPPETVAVAPAAPGVFTAPGNRAVAQNQDFTLNTPSNPAPRGSVVIVYLTGHGAVSPSVPTGQAAPPDPLSRATGGSSASIGGVSAPVLFLGLTPGLVGVAQANVLVPDGAPAGDQVLLVSIAGQAANAALISVR